MPECVATLAIACVLVAACGGSTPQPPAPARPASPAVIQITSPVVGSSIKGPMVDVVVAIQNARIVQATTRNIKPDEGHVHLFIDNNLQYMGFTPSQSFALTHPGTYTMYAEFVASDHVPFNPRVKSKPIVFTVT